MDITFILNSFGIDHKIILQDIKNVLIKHETYKKRYKFQANMPRKDSSGWILRFKDEETKIDVDIMVNKYSEHQNSLLIKSYTNLDIRCLKLIQILKVWNKGLTKEVFNRLNNFTIYLMLIGFMQKEKFLPNLQLFAKSHLWIVKHQIQVTYKDTSINIRDGHNVHFIT